MARLKMASEPSQTIGATALVHEAWLRIGEGNDKGARQEFENRRHFFGAAAEAMRRILIDRARARTSQKRGGEFDRADEPVSQILAPGGDDEDILAVNDAVEKFAKVDPECTELVKLKYFVGMTWEEIAELTGESTRTIRRRWAYAKSWLYEEIKKEQA